MRWGLAGADHNFLVLGYVESVVATLDGSRIPGEPKVDIAAS
jgi:hypothetical protein